MHCTCTVDMADESDTDVGECCRHEQERAHSNRPKYTASMNTSVIEITDRYDPCFRGKGEKLNPFLARGAFGEVRIALLVRTSSSSPSPFPSCSPGAVELSPARSEYDSTGEVVRKVSLAAIKTIPNAVVSEISAFGFSRASGRVGGDCSGDVSSPSSRRRQLTREAFAELNALRLLGNHENVTLLLGYHGEDPSAGSAWSDVCGGRGDGTGVAMMAPSTLCLVFEFHPVDLADALAYRRLQPSFPLEFAPSDAKKCGALEDGVVQSIIHDLLSALRHCHSHGIIHRDVKPGNIYIASNGRVLLGDFGLAKAVPDLLIKSKAEKESNTDVEGGRDSAAPNFLPSEQNPNVTQGMCTLQYRPPELLFGSNHHDTPAIDVWGAACILAELLSLSGPLFSGRNVLDQLARIFSILGTPEESWPGVSKLPDYGKIIFEDMPGQPLKEVIGPRVEKKVVRIGNVSGTVGDLMTSMLTFDPSCRPSASDCLSHPWLDHLDACRGGDGNSQSSEESYSSLLLGRREVVEALVPQFLRTPKTIFFSPCTTNSRASSMDPFAFAKTSAAKLAATRRAFPEKESDDGLCGDLLRTGKVKNNKEIGSTPAAEPSKSGARSQLFVRTCSLKCNGLIGALIALRCGDSS